MDTWKQASVGGLGFGVEAWGDDPGWSPLSAGSLQAEPSTGALSAGTAGTQTEQLDTKTTDYNYPKTTATMDAVTTKITWCAQVDSPKTLDTGGTLANFFRDSAQQNPHAAGRH